jgi:hypothetical protein
MIYGNGEATDRELGQLTALVRIPHRGLVNLEAYEPALLSKVDAERFLTTDTQPKIRCSSALTSTALKIPSVF